MLAFRLRMSTIAENPLFHSVSRRPCRCGPTSGGSAGPAWPSPRADLDEGDVIVGLDDRPVAEIDDLHRLLTEDRVGVRTNLTIVRGSEAVQVTIVPAEATAAA